MRFFIDLEFVERTQQLVSIGIARQDGATFYAINQDCLGSISTHPWLTLNVLPWLPVTHDFLGPLSILDWDKSHAEYDAVAPLDMIPGFVLKFLTEVDDGKGIELWADYGAYDYVIFARMWGDMNDLPSGVPMFIHEFRQLLEMFEPVQLPPQPEATHHALADAIWLRDAYQAVLTG